MTDEAQIGNLESPRFDTVMDMRSRHSISDNQRIAELRRQVEGLPLYVNDYIQDGVAYFSPQKSRCYLSPKTMRAVIGKPLPEDSDLPPFNFHRLRRWLRFTKSPHKSLWKSNRYFQRTGKRQTGNSRLIVRRNKERWMKKERLEKQNKTSPT